VAIDPHGKESRGTLEVADSYEAVKRIKEMGLFPTRVLEQRAARLTPGLLRPGTSPRPARPHLAFWPFGTRLPASALAVFTRQLATLLEAGMPLLRGLRTLQQQAESRALKQVIDGMAQAIEAGMSLSESLQQYPKVFNRLYVSMVKAGEISGSLEITLRRMSEFMEKSQSIKRKVMAAMMYPCAVLLMAGGILLVLMSFVVPRFRAVFDGLLDHRGIPPFTAFVFGLSTWMQHHVWFILGALAAVVAGFVLMAKLKSGRFILDYFKLRMPIVGGLFRKVALARFARTLGTLAGSGVPILQALTIVREATGNAVLARVVGKVHEDVKQGEPMAPALKASSIFPSMVSGMVDVGEQTGALPDMLMKVADVCEDEVDTATSALTSLLEPVLIIFLAIIVGSIVIAMFLPLISISDGFSRSGDDS
jgi:type IV pilus assembly protein PilC